jgi:hypothetical protein
MLRHQTKTRQQLLDDDISFGEPLVTIEGSPSLLSGQATLVAPRQLATAMLAWMMGTFVVAYLLLPAFLEAAGIYSGLLDHLGDSFRAFVLTMGVVLAGVLTLRPKVQLHDLSSKRSADPVLAATSGSLLTWAILHSTMPMLRPLYDMGSTELAGFLGLNIVECLMFGMMLASLVRSRAAAFSLGALFQALFMISAGWFFIV